MEIKQVKIEDLKKDFSNFEPEVIKMWTARKVENGELLGQPDDNDINHYHFFRSKDDCKRASKVAEKKLKEAGGEIASIEIVVGYKKSFN